MKMILLIIGREVGIGGEVEVIQGEEALEVEVVQTEEALEEEGVQTEEALEVEAVQTEVALEVEVVLTGVVLEVEAIQTGVVLEVGAVEGGIKVVAGTTETILVRIISPLNGTKGQTIMGKGGKVMMVLSVGAKEVVIRGQGIGILGLAELAINMGVGIVRVQVGTNQKGL